MDKLKDLGINKMEYMKLPSITFPQFKDAKNQSKGLHDRVQVNKKITAHGFAEEFKPTKGETIKMLEKQARLRTLLQARNKTITRIEDFEREKEMLESGFVWELGCGFSLENIKQYIGMEYSLLKELNDEIGLKRKDAEKIFTWEELAKKF